VRSEKQFMVLILNVDAEMTVKSDFQSFQNPSITPIPQI